MKELIGQLIATVISAAIFMTLSVRLGWSKRIWSVINRKLNPVYNATVWILFAAVLHISIQWACGALGMSNTRLITGILIGLYFAFLPNLGVKKDGKK